MVIWPWSSAGLWLLSPFCCFVLYFSICYHILDWFLHSCSLFWCSHLLPLPVCPCPLLRSWVLVSPASAHGIFTASSTGLWLSSLLLFCFGFIYLLIIYYTFFPFSFSHFAHVDILVCFATTPLEFLRSRNVSLQSYMTTTLTLLPNSCISPVG
jgi:hypothetical protein